MSWSQKLKQWAADRRRWVALTLLGVFLSVFALTLSEALHRVLHTDACSPQHQCAVTMLQSGHVEMPDCDAAIVPAAVVSVSVPLVENNFVPSVDYSLPPSCGPPALLA